MARKPSSKRIQRPIPPKRVRDEVDKTTRARNYEYTQKADARQHAMRRLSIFLPKKLERERKKHLQTENGIDMDILKHPLILGIQGGFLQVLEGVRQKKKTSLVPLLVDPKHYMTQLVREGLDQLQSTFEDGEVVAEVAWTMSLFEGECSFLEALSCINISIFYVCILGCIFIVRIVSSVLNLMEHLSAHLVTCSLELLSYVQKNVLIVIHSFPLIYTMNYIFY